MMRIAAATLLGLSLLLGGCAGHRNIEAASSTPEPPGITAHGYVLDISQDRRQVKLQEDAIPDLHIPPGKLSYAVQDTNVLNGVHPYDEVEFKLQQTPQDRLVVVRVRVLHGGEQSVP